MSIVYEQFDSIKNMNEEAYSSSTYRVQVAAGDHIRSTISVIFIVVLFVSFAIRICTLCGR